MDWEIVPDQATVNKWRAERAAALDKMNNLLTRAESQNRNLTPAEKAEWDDLSAKADRLEAEIRKALAPRARGAFGAGPERETSGVFLRSDQRLADVVPDRLGGVPRGELSFGRLVRALVTGDWSGAESERRALGEGTVTAGGYLVPSPLAGMVLDLARAKTVVTQAGAVTIPMTSSTVRLVSVGSDPVPSWKSENTELGPASMTFGSLTLTARTLAVWLPVSIELLEDAPNAAEVVESVVSASMAVALDKAALTGSGTGAEPLGLLNTPGLSGVVCGIGNGAVPTSYQPFVQACQLVRMSNHEPGAVIMSPRTAGTLDGLVDSTGQPLVPPPVVAGLKRLTTTSIPDNLVVGTSNDCSVAFIGDFSQLCLGMRTDLLVEVERPLGGVEGRSLQAVVRAYLRADVAVLRPAAFAKIEGIRG